MFGKKGASIESGTADLAWIKGQTNKFVFHNDLKANRSSMNF